MKYLFLTLLFVALPVFAYDYERTPTGTEIPSPVTISVTFDESELDDVGIWDDATYWCIAFESVVNGTLYGTQTPKPTLITGNTATQNFTLMEGDEISEIWIYGMLDNSECSNVNSANGGYKLLSSDGFTVIESNNGYFPVGTTMTNENTKNTVLNRLIDWSGAVFSIIVAIIGIGVAYLIYRYGWKMVKKSLSDKSLQIGGFYVRNTPWKGYSRFRSKKWNMEHMP